MYISLIATGITKLFFTKLKIEKGSRVATYVSILLSILCVLVLALAQEPYAVVLVFMLLIAKGLLLLKYMKI